MAMHQIRISTNSAKLLNVKEISLNSSGNLFEAQSLSIAFLKCFSLGNFKCFFFNFAASILRLAALVSLPMSNWLNLFFPLMIEAV